MKFHSDYRITDLAMGLTAVACSSEKDHTRLSDVCSILAKETHETMFDRAQEIAGEYGGVIRIEAMAHEDMFVEDMQGFSIGETQNGRVCVLWGGNDGPIMPTDHSAIAASCPPPDIWTVFRAYAITVN